jgi:hypothetical protein
MKIKYIFLQLLLLISINAFSEKPLFEWNFKNAISQNKSYVFKNETDKHKGQLVAAKWNPELGIYCNNQLSNRAYFGKFRPKAATIKMSFTPLKQIDKKATLFAYQENTWGKAYFGVFLTTQKQIGIILQKLDDGKIKKFEMITSPVNFAVNEYYDLKITIESGGMARIFLNGKLLKEENNALGFSDFTHPPIDRYHPFAQIGSSYISCNLSQPFYGLINKLELYNCIESNDASKNNPPKTAKSDYDSREDCNIQASLSSSWSPNIDGVFNEECWGKSEWSKPFMTLGTMSKDINGLWVVADKKFQKYASTAAVCSDKKNIYVAIKAPIPPNIPLKTNAETGGLICTDDCVELFIRPPGKNYYQILVNSKGFYTALKYPNLSTNGNKWKNAELKIAASRNDKGFQVEIAIPLSSFEEVKAVESGDLWNVNFTREGKTCGGLSTWAPVGTSFLAPDRFGKLIWGSRKKYFQKECNSIQESFKKINKNSNNINKELKSLLSYINAHGNKRNAWMRINNRLMTIHNSLIQLTNEGKKQLIWQQDIWENFSPKCKIPFALKETKEINVTSPRGVKAVTAFRISNISQRELMTRISFIPDKSCEKVFRPSFVNIQEVAFIELNGGKMIPDPIFPLPLGAMMRIAPGTTSMVWINIDCRNLQAGNYSGIIELYPSYSGFETKKIRLNLKVSKVNLKNTFVRTWTYAIRTPWIIKELAEYGFNTIIPIPVHYYPKEGVITKDSFPALDEMIDTLIATGIPKNEIFILFYPEFSLWSNIHIHGKTLKFMDKEWQKIVAERLYKLRNHLKNKYGISYNQYAFYPTDEPNGNPDNPEDKAYFAFVGGRFLKSVDPKFRLFANPYKLNDGRHQQYFELFDILEPFYPQMADKPELVEAYKNSGREIWTYHIFEKCVPPNAYRHIFWTNLAAGFNGPATFYDLKACNGDNFNSYDKNPNSNSVADYGTIYVNRALKKIVLSRRMEAWGQGLVDFKIVSYCKNNIAKLKSNGTPTASLAKELDSIIKRFSAKNENLDSARRKLLKLAEKIEALRKNQK